MTANQNSYVDEWAVCSVFDVGQSVIDSSRGRVEREGLIARQCYTTVYRARWRHIVTLFDQVLGM